MLTDIFTNLLPDSTPWLIYLIILAGPFVQEDAAVVAAAGLSASGQTELWPTVAAIFTGLFLSDIWKYWIGYFALKNNKIRTFSRQDKVMGLQEKVQDFTLTTLITARFVPLTRIPVYVACGFFKISYIKFCIYIALTAALYISIIFATFHILGALMAEQVKWVLPIVGITLVLVMVGVQIFRNRRKP